MKKRGLYILFFLISINCMGQETALTLQRVELKDKTLEKIVENITTVEKGCFRRAEYYIFNFFISSVSIDKYYNEFYLSLRAFSFHRDTKESFSYYIIINNIVFFVPNVIPDGLFNISAEKKQFIIDTDWRPTLGGDDNFLIYGTSINYYKVISSTCAE